MTQPSKNQTQKDSELNELRAIHKELSEIKEGMLAFFTGISKALGTKKVEDASRQDIDKCEVFGIEESLKNHIEMIKESISQSMAEIDEAERNYDFNSAAAIKYGKLTIQQAHLERMEIELKKVKGI